MPRPLPIRSALYWFLGAFVVHVTVSFVLFSIVFAMPDGSLTKLAGAAWDVLEWPLPLVSSLLWASGAAAVGAIMASRHRAA